MVDRVQQRHRMAAEAVAGRLHIVHRVAGEAAADRQEVLAEAEAAGLAVAEEEAMSRPAAEVAEATAVARTVGVTKLGFSSRQQTPPFSGRRSYSHKSA
jgi:hypothetical protein